MTVRLDRICAVLNDRLLADIEVWYEQQPDRIKSLKQSFSASSLPTKAGADSMLDSGEGLLGVQVAMQCANPCVIATALVALALRAVFCAAIGDHKLSEITLAADGRKLPIFARQTPTELSSYFLSQPLMRLLCSVYHVSERQVERHMAKWMLWFTSANEYPFISGQLTTAKILPQLEIILEHLDIISFICQNKEPPDSIDR
jgi:hypothetical protein